MSKELILIVDDNPGNLKLARDLLTSEGYNVSTAIDAEEALLSLKNLLPRLIILDLNLPVMDGLMLTRQIKADSATRDIAVIAVTAYIMRWNEQAALEAGCDCFITKPIDTRALPGIVARYLAKA
jgi:CheY-like chemotaxis protein